MRAQLEAKSARVESLEAELLRTGEQYKMSLQKSVLVAEREKLQAVEEATARCVWKPPPSPHGGAGTPSATWAHPSR